MDVGGSGIKAAVVDIDAGALPVRAPARPDPAAVHPGAGPAPRSPGSSGGWPRRAGIAGRRPVGVGLPGVTMEGPLLTAANIDPAWVDYPIAENLTKR